MSTIICGECRQVIKDVFKHDCPVPFTPENQIAALKDEVSMLQKMLDSSDKTQKNLIRCIEMLSNGLTAAGFHKDARFSGIISEMNKTVELYRDGV